MRKLMWLRTLSRGCLIIPILLLFSACEKEGPIFRGIFPDDLFQFAQIGEGDIYLVCENVYSMETLPSYMLDGIGIDGEKAVGIREACIDEKSLFSIAKATHKDNYCSKVPFRHRRTCQRFAEGKEIDSCAMVEGGYKRKFAIEAAERCQAGETKYCDWSGDEGYKSLGAVATVNLDEDNWFVAHVDYSSGYGDPDIEPLVFGKNVVGYTPLLNFSEEKIKGRIWLSIYQYDNGEAKDLPGDWHLDRKTLDLRKVPDSVTDPANRKNPTRYTEHYACEVSDFNSVKSRLIELNNFVKDTHAAKQQKALLLKRQKELDEIAREKSLRQKSDGNQI